MLFILFGVIIAFNNIFYHFYIHNFYRFVVGNSDWVAIWLTKNTMATTAFGRTHCISVTFQHFAKFIKAHIFVKRQYFSNQLFPTRHIVNVLV